MTVSGVFRLALCRVTFVVRVHKTAKTSAITADDDNGLANPASDVLDILATGATHSIHNVDEVRGQVAEHVYVAGRGCEGHDHGGILDEAKGLRAEGVEEMVVGAAGREGGCVGFLGVGVDGREAFGAAFAGSRGRVGDGVVGRAKGSGAGARGGPGAERGGVDEDEESCPGEVGVVEVREDGLARSVGCIF